MHEFDDVFHVPARDARTNDNGGDLESHERIDADTEVAGRFRSAEKSLLGQLETGVIRCFRQCSVLVHGHYQQKDGRRRRRAPI